MKIVINNCFGGFGLSQKALTRYAALQGRECFFFSHDYCDGAMKYRPISAEETPSSFSTAFDTSEVPDPVPDGWYSAHTIGYYDIERTDPFLIQVVEELGDEASGDYARLIIVEVPDDVEWSIEEYDGNEHIAEAHRTWC